MRCKSLKGDRDFGYELNFLWIKLLIFDICKDGSGKDCGKEGRKFKMKWVWIGISLRRNSRYYASMEWMFWNSSVLSGTVGILKNKREEIKKTSR